MNKKCYKIEIITRPEMFDELKDALNNIGVMGMTVYEVEGCGAQKGYSTYYRGVQREITLTPKIKIETVVSEVPVDTVLETAEKVLKTGRYGDGKIFVSELCNVLRVRTGERNWFALQD